MDDDKENCVRLPRAAKKRAAAAIAEQQATKKNRVVLGELSLSSNILVPENSFSGEDASPRNKSTRIKRRVTRVPTTTTTPSSLSHARQKLDDPQMALPYASDIYEYLRNLEVKKRGFYLETEFYELFSRYLEGLLVCRLCWVSNTGRQFNQEMKHGLGVSYISPK